MCGFLLEIYVGNLSFWGAGGVGVYFVPFGGVVGTAVLLFFGVAGVEV